MRGRISYWVYCLLLGYTPNFIGWILIMLNWVHIMLSHTRYPYSYTHFQWEKNFFQIYTMGLKSSHTLKLNFLKEKFLIDSRLVWEFKNRRGLERLKFPSYSKFNKEMILAYPIFFGFVTPKLALTVIRSLSTLHVRVSFSSRAENKNPPNWHCVLFRKHFLTFPRLHMALIR